MIVSRRSTGLLFLLRTLVVLSLVCAWLAIRQPPAQACSCELGTVIDDLEASDVVFRGEVTLIRRPDDYNTFVIFRVSRLWKGNVGPTIGLWAVAQHDDDCGYVFIKGFEYFVFSNGHSTSTCSYTSRIVHGRPEWPELGAGREPVFAARDLAQMVFWGIVLSTSEAAQGGIETFSVLPSRLALLFLAGSLHLELGPDD